MEEDTLPVSFIWFSLLQMFLGGCVVKMATILKLIRIVKFYVFHAWYILLCIVLLFRSPLSSPHPADIGIYPTRYKRGDSGCPLSDEADRQGGEREEEEEEGDMCGEAVEDLTDSLI